MPAAPDFTSSPILLLEKMKRKKEESRLPPNRAVTELAYNRFCQSVNSRGQGQAALCAYVFG